MKNLEDRKNESKRLRSKYVDYIPVIIEKGNSDLELDKNKFLVPNDFTFSQLIYIIRKRLKISPEKALFLITRKGVMINSSEIIIDLYEKYKEEDDFFYLKIYTESTFG